MRPALPSGRARWRSLLYALAGASAVSVALVGARVAITGRDDGLNLVWNLFLAWIPLAVAGLLVAGHRRGAPAVWVAAVGALWLLFLPNAPYILTDYKLLRDWSGASPWVDVTVISAAAWTGLGLGLFSLWLVHGLLRRLIGGAASWAVIVTVLALSSFGVYLGRVHRWNSWDVATQPGSLLTDVAERLDHPLAHERMVAATVVFTAFLTVAYTLFDAAMRSRSGERRD